MHRAQYKHLPVHAKDMVTLTPTWPECPNDLWPRPRCEVTPQDATATIWKVMQVLEQWKRPDLAFCSKVLVLVWGQTTCWNDPKFLSLLSNTMMIISTKFGHKWTTARSTCCTTVPTGQKVFVLWCGQHTGHLDLKLGTA